MKLSCRSAENLLLSDEALALLPTQSWEGLQTCIEAWLGSFPEEHPHRKVMQDFKDAGYPRKSFNLKDIRNDLLSLSGDARDWELVVGIALGKLAQGEKREGENSISAYLGEKIIRTLF